MSAYFGTQAPSRPFWGLLGAICRAGAKIRFPGGAEASAKLADPLDVAPKPNSEDVHAAADKVDQCFQQEAGQPESCRGAAFRALQFLPHPQDTADDASNGSRHRRSVLGRGRPVDLG